MFPMGKSPLAAPTRFWFSAKSGSTRFNYPLWLKRIVNQRMNIIEVSTKNISTSRKTKLSIQSSIAVHTLLDVILMNKIASPQPPWLLGPIDWSTPENIHVKVDFYQPYHIDLLIGAEFHIEFLSLVQIGNNPPVLRKTLLGWIITGTLRIQFSSTADL